MNTSYVLNNLIPGATFEVKAYTVRPNGESATYISRNFTTKPSSPYELIVWFRNETILLIQWQPPGPSSIFSHFKVSIDPPDTIYSTLYVEIDDESPGPPYAAFKGLVPGRPYNISVHTMSGDQISAPAIVQSRTVPSKPGKIAFNPNLITSSSFVVNWEEPNGKSEFDKYQVFLVKKNSKQKRQIEKLREEPIFAEFNNLEPGETYQVTVKTVSGKESSWPVTGKVTLKPPSDLSIKVLDEKSAIISWLPYYYDAEIKLRIYALDNVKVESKTLIINNSIDTSYVLNNLTQGATYEVEAYTVLQDRQSATYTSRNFTIKPNSPGKMIVWFRNETSLLILWQPPAPAGIFSHYKISIDPPDTIDSVLYVEKEGVPPGPAQAAFKGLVPGRPYNISVYTMSGDQISAPVIAQYRTVPSKPGKIAFNPNLITSSSFVVNWEEPNGKSEFDKYQVFLVKKNSKQKRQIEKLREEPIFAEFNNLEPGETYHVTVKAVSGKVSSWPLTGEVTLKPLSGDQHPKTDNKNGSTISWYPHLEKSEGDYWVKWKSRRL